MSVFLGYINYICKLIYTCRLLPLYHKCPQCTNPVQPSTLPLGTNVIDIVMKLYYPVRDPVGTYTHINADYFFCAEMVELACTHTLDAAYADHSQIHVVAQHLQMHADTRACTIT